MCQGGRIARGFPTCSEEKGKGEGTQRESDRLGRPEVSIYPERRELSETEPTTRNIHGPDWGPWNKYIRGLPGEALVGEGALNLKDI